jgi:hypothetical protein
MIKESKITLLTIFVGLLFQGGCSAYIKHLESNDEVEILKKSTYKGQCQEIKKDNWVHSHLVNINPFLQSLQKHSFSFIEKNILYALYMQMLRPDAVSSQARIQLITGGPGKKTIYLDLEPKDQSPTPYYQALSATLKKFKSSRSLNQLIRFANKNFPYYLPVGLKLSNFLSTHIDDIRKEDFQFNRFLKGGQPVQFGETFKRYPLPSSPRFKKTSSTPLLYDFPTKQEGKSIQCNVDLKIYQDKIFVFKNTFSPQVATFGYYNQKGDFFFAVVHQEIDFSESKRSLLEMSKTSNKKTFPFCMFKNTQMNQNILLMSMAGKDPGQILYHLIQYDIFNASTLEELNEFLKFPRHQFIPKPKRLYFESTRGSKEQLASFLKHDFPLYHAEILGNIWAYGQYPEKRLQGLVTDERYPIEQSCQPDY